jgi:stage III sporulation protein AH
MNVLIKRRQLVLATLVVALGAAVFVNWYYTGNNSTIQSPEETTGSEYVQNLGEAKYVNATGEEADYFSEVKLNRQKSRDEALEALNKSLEKAKSGSEEAKKITASIDELTAQIKLESDVESLISAKLASECVAVINEKSAQIVVSKDALSEDVALQIIDVITTNTDLPTDKIKITEAE